MGTHVMKIKAIFLYLTHLITYTTHKHAHTVCGRSIIIPFMGTVSIVLLVYITGREVDTVVKETRDSQWEFLTAWKQKAEQAVIMTGND